MRSTITYFEEPGKCNSRETYDLARARAEELGIKSIVIASIRGLSVPEVLNAFSGSDIRILFATCDACNGCPRFLPKMIDMLEQEGHKLIHANEHAYPYPPEAEMSYRRFCEGMKVAVHLAIAVVEDGHIPEGEEIIAIAGTGWKDFVTGGGSDTAVVIEATSADRWWSYPATMNLHKTEGRKIKEIICMPR